MTAVHVAESLKYGLKLFGYFLGVVIVGGGGLALGYAIAFPSTTRLFSGTPSEGMLAGSAVLGFLGAFVLVTGLFGILYKLVADAVSVGVADGSPAIDIPGEIDLAAPAGAAPVSGDGQQTETGPTGPSPGEQAAQHHGEKQTVPAASGTSVEEEPRSEEVERGEPEREEPTEKPPVSEASDESAEVADRETVIEPESGPDGSSEVTDRETVIEPGSDHGDGSEVTDRETVIEPGSDHGDGSEVAERETVIQPGSEKTEQSPDRTADQRETPPEPTPEEIAFGTREDIEDGDENTTDDSDDSDETTGSTGSVAGSSASGDPLADPTDEE